MSPAGISISAPICLLSSRMKETQNFRISLSDFPFGSKSAPPLAPPIFTVPSSQSISQPSQVALLLTTSKSILEDLLKAQKLQDRKIDRGVETKTAFVWAESGVELHTVATVDLHLALVVFPDNAELNDSFRDRGNLQRGLVLWVLLEE